MFANTILIKSELPPRERNSGLLKFMSKEMSVLVRFTVKFVTMTGSVLLPMIETSTMSFSVILFYLRRLFGLGLFFCYFFLLGSSLRSAKDIGLVN